MKQLFTLALLGAALVAGKAEAQGYCREFSQGVSIGGQVQSSYGVACMQPDGSWQIASNGQNGYNNVGYMPPPPPPVTYYTPPPATYYAPPPVAYYPPPPPIMRSGISFSFGVPFHQGRGDCDEHRWGFDDDDRRGWHHGYGRGWGEGYNGWHGHRGWRD